MWELIRKHCPIRRFCFFVARQFVETAELVRVFVDFYSGKGCNRHVRNHEKKAD
jgi:hypothetical protein